MLDFPDGIDEYATAHTTVPDSVFDDIAVDVQSTGAAGMMSGRTVGYFLNTLVTISNAKRVSRSRNLRRLQRVDDGICIA